MHVIWLLSSWIAAVYRFTARRGSALQVLSKATAFGCLALLFAPTYGHKLQTAIGNRGGGNLGHTACMPPDSSFQARVFGGRCDIYMFLICLQPDLAWWFARAASSSKASLVGGNISRALLPFLKRWSLAWSTVGCAGVPYRWQTNCGCLVSIATNSVDEEWLVLEDFPALLLSMTTEGWGWITAC